MPYFCLKSRRMHIRPFRALYPDLDYVTSSDSFFKGIKEQYPEYRRSGLFKQQEQEGLYVYQIRHGDHSFTGILALADIADYQEGLIKRHENTLAEKEQIHLNLLLRNRAIVKPVLLTHPPVDALSRLLLDISSTREPDFTLHFEDGNMDHSWWALTDPARIREVARIFREEIGHAYIADGHHRSSAVSLLYDRRGNHPELAQCDGLLAAYFAADQVEILDFNRIVDVFAEITPTQFMARLSRIMDIEEAEGPVKPAAPHELTMYLQREWYRLKWKPEVMEEYRQDAVVLDARIFDDQILTGLMEVTDIRTDSRILYFPGVYGEEGFRHIVNEKEIRVGFCLYPVSLKDMMTLSDEGGVLPPKSTWFQPRLKNGIIAHEF